MAKVYGYLRVSTLEQLHGLDAQRDTIQRTWGYLFKDKLDEQGRPNELAGEFVDHGVSGGTPFRQRPEGSRLAATLAEGDVVIVSKLDRAFRNVRDAAETLEWLAEKRIWLVVVDMGIDTRTPIGRMLVAILAAVAAFERERLSERCREARAAAKAAGKRYDEVPRYGFTLSPKSARGKRRIVPDPYTRHCVRLFMKWHDEEGLSRVKIAVRCLIERIYQRPQAGFRPGREWNDATIERCIAAERRLMKYEAEHGPLCPPEEIAAIRVGKFSR